MISPMKPTHFPRPSGSFFTPLLPPAPPISKVRQIAQSPLPGLILIGVAMVGLHFGMEATRANLREGRARNRLNGQYAPMMLMTTGGTAPQGGMGLAEGIAITHAFKDPVKGEERLV